MMEAREHVFRTLERNHAIFHALLAGSPREEYTWRPAEEKWCLLEIVCHLYDEEREDFRARIRHVLEDPSKPFSPIDPPAWVTDRKYMEQDFGIRLNEFLGEREESVRWLRSLKNPHWENAFVHPKFGAHSAAMLLANWLAHDYLHFRQITKLRYDYLRQISGEDLGYAGTW